MEPVAVRMNDGRKGWKWPDDGASEFLSKVFRCHPIEVDNLPMAFKQGGIITWRRRERPR